MSLELVKTQKSISEKSKKVALRIKWQRSGRIKVMMKMNEKTGAIHITFLPENHSSHIITS